MAGRERRHPRPDPRRPPPPSPPPHRSRAAGLALAAIVIAGVALSGYWAYRVPIFQAPDEDVHFDYVAQLITAGRPLRAAERPQAERLNPFVPYSHPYTWYLRVRTNSDGIRFKPQVKVEPGYGTRSYFAALERGAPRLRQPPLRNAWVISEYPVGYYGLAALLAGLARPAFPGVVAAFFVARATSVLLFGIGLLAWHAVFRRLASGRRALLLTAAVAIYPLSSFVSSYVQPDNLAFTAAGLALASALAVLRSAGPPTERQLLALGAALALCLLAKYHLFAAVAVPVGAALVARVWRRPWPQRRRRAALLLVPCLLALALQLWITAGGSGLRNLTYDSRRSQLLEKVEHSRLLYSVRVFESLLKNYFVGDTFRTFSGSFGWLDTPLVIGSPQLDAALELGIKVAMAVVLAFALHRLLDVWVRLLRVRRRRRRAAVRVLLGNPAVNALLFYSALMVGLYLYTANGYMAQARQWFPVLPLLFWAGIDWAPRALSSRRAARVAGALLLAGLLGYAVAGSYWALRAIETRYYQAPGQDF